ncbi:hypothetical protein PHSY_001894 [Pseudozyma hubeiensis SY62]|uniref:Gylcosyl hydrolase 115 C-terminal domain-containing protein n=1 Tax=Pseudozyma hubeiensis (strain SY62) TaxID=1305764 RepID=R9NZP1_PSEHS|nr:hypothetical protein PHSY_001894 [Pseudozyma hubeiensis SY62]GAC94323.1 hypothetical protein PHSY_001894 [Pseudozyma hubeiensis SY62]
MRALSLWTTLLLGLTATYAQANSNTDTNNDNVCLSTASSSDGYLIAKSGETTEVLTSSHDAPVVHHAAASFAADLMQMVPSSNVVVRNVTSASLKMQAQQNKERMIIVGSLDSSSLMPELMSMDSAVSQEASKVKGQWESWSSVKLSSGSGLVLMGSDKRGAAYALYTLSEELGVSPWKWFADVKPTQSHSAEYYSPKSSASSKSFGTSRCSHGPPLVKYRGIFLNDEAPALTNWARTHFKGPFPPETAPQSFNDAMYTHVFELLLRLKANLLWPAMWSDSFAVAGLPDLPNKGVNGTGAAGPNQKLADRLGIVFGTSHQEPMGRNTPEWNTWYQGPWDYPTNTENITTYWKYGVERAQGLETMFTMSMRGNGDKALAGANIQLLEEIMVKQQSLLPRDAKSGEISVPQMMCLYTEVQGYYNEGLKVPEDITLLWTDDNFGFIRRIPTEEEKKNRSGGAGLYYHADYVGPPRAYKWVNTVNLMNAWEQLNVAFLNQQTEMFILNVGDLKPVEVPIHFTLNMAYDNTDLLHPTNVSSWLDTWAAKTFGHEPASKVAEVIRGYSWLNSRIKPEIVNASTWSSVHYAEAESVLSHWDHLVSIVEGDLIPYFRNTPNWDSFYQLVAYPTLASSNLNRMYVAIARNNLAGTQAKNSANSWSLLARSLFHNDARLTESYHALAGGKWKHMMSQPHMGSQYWQQPMRNMMPALSQVEVVDSEWPDTAMGSNLRVSVDGSMGAWPGDNQYNCADGYNCPDPSLKMLSRYEGNQRRRVWVSSADAGEFAFSATTNASWLQVQQPRIATLETLARDGMAGGTNLTERALFEGVGGWVEKRSDGFEAGGNFDDEVEVAVKVDWSQLAEMDCATTNSTQRLQTGIVYINTTTFPSEQYVGMWSPTNVTVSLTVDPCTFSSSSHPAGTFVSSSDGSVSMLAAHALVEPARSNSTPTYLEVLPQYGLLGSAITVLPPTADSIPPASGPSLSFPFIHSTSPPPTNNGSAYNVTLYLSPILNYRDKRPLKYVLELDDDVASRTTVTPVPDNITPGTNSADWGNVVSANIRKVTTMLRTNSTSGGGKHTIRWWPLEPGLVLEKVVVEPQGSMTVATALGMPESGRVGMI